MQRFGFRLKGFGFGVLSRDALQGLGFKTSGFRVYRGPSRDPMQGFGFRLHGFGFRVLSRHTMQGLGFRLKGFGFRVLK